MSDYEFKVKSQLDSDLGFESLNSLHDKKSHEHLSIDLEQF